MQKPIGSIGWFGIEVDFQGRSGRCCQWHYEHVNMAGIKRSSGQGHVFDRLPAHSGMKC